MTIDKIREYFADRAIDDAIILENPDFASAFIGHSDDGRAVYDYYKMVDHLMKEEGMSEEDAADFISYNTLRAIPYFGEKAPIVIYQEVENEMS